MQETNTQAGTPAPSNEEVVNNAPSASHAELGEGMFEVECSRFVGNADAEWDSEDGQPCSIVIERERWDKFDAWTKKIVTFASKKFLQHNVAGKFRAGKVGRYETRVDDIVYGSPKALSADAIAWVDGMLGKLTQEATRDVILEGLTGGAKQYGLDLWAVIPDREWLVSYYHAKQRYLLEQKKFQF